MFLSREIGRYGGSISSLSVADSRQKSFVDSNRPAILIGAGSRPIQLSLLFFQRTIALEKV
jgi:hypothetical protein